MKTLLLLVPIISLTFVISCNKKDNAVDQKSIILGNWISQNRVAWFTIDETNSTGEGIPTSWYYISPKDTFSFPDEKLTFKADGKLYVEVGNTIINSQSALPPQIKFPKDTITYSYSGNNLTLVKNGITTTIEVVELTGQNMTLYNKTVLNGAIKEDWTYYRK